MGTYRSAAPAADADAPSGVPDGDGDFDGDGEHAGYAYSGGWRLGRPRGVGWWRYGGSGVYAGEVDDGWHHGRGAYWGADGQRCFEGEWARGYAVGDGAMLLEDGALWRVRFDDRTWLYGDGLGWDTMACLKAKTASGPSRAAAAAGGRPRKSSRASIPTLQMSDGKEHSRPRTRSGAMWA